MKTKIIKKALFILYIGLSFSCKKNTEEKEVTFPHSLYPESISKKTDIRLFSNQKEITDPEVKRRFVHHLEIFNLQNSSFQDLEKMTFLSKDTAEFSVDSKFSIVVNFKIKKLNLFTRKLSYQLLKKSTLFAEFEAIKRWFLGFPFFD